MLYNSYSMTANIKGLNPNHQIPPLRNSPTFLKCQNEYIILNAFFMRKLGVSLLQTSIFIK